MNTSLEPKGRAVTLTRAEKFAEVRSFFAARGVIEADPFLLSPFAPVIDVHIDPMKVVDRDQEYYLHTSPEFGLKRLVMRTGLDLYSLGHVFRSKELSRRHCPEFTMVEWYRYHCNQEFFIQEILDFLTLFLPPLPHTIYSYQDLYTPLEPLFADVEKEHPLWDRACIKDYLFSLHVQPSLGQNEISIVTNFPEEEAALAQMDGGTARRYEFFYQGLELGNGYHELTNPATHRSRFEENNDKRAHMGKERLPLDPHFLADLADFPLPEDTFGIAIGFDRLLMLHEKTSSIHDILPLPWSLP